MRDLIESSGHNGDGNVAMAKRGGEGVLSITAGALGLSLMLPQGYWQITLCLNRLAVLNCAQLETEEV